MNYPKHLYIPYFHVLSESLDDKSFIIKEIKNSFIINNFGEIKKISLNVIHDIYGNLYYECFIEMNKWFTSHNSQRILSCITDKNKNKDGLTLYYNLYNIKNRVIKIRAYDPKKTPKGFKTSYEEEMFSNYNLINH